MDVFRKAPPLPRPLRRPVVAIGNFDGVHLGHERLFEVTRARAAAVGGEAVVLTFEPHPAKLLAPALAPPLLTTPEQKLERIAACGIEVCVVLPFTRELAAQSPDEFVRGIIVDGLGAREVVVGYDFTYGHKRAGNVDTLRTEGTRLGFAVHVVPPVTVEGIVASSTKIREFVHEGNVTGARLLLGRPYAVDGRVVRGAGRGRPLGVPTANVATENELLPRPGVYAARVGILDGSGARLGAVVNLGTNPTFVADGRLSLEAHLLDWEGDLYDRRVRVEFLAWLRPEERFPGPEALVAQIRRDIEAARAHLLAEESQAPHPRRHQ